MLLVSVIVREVLTPDQNPYSDFRKNIEAAIKLHNCAVHDVDRLTFAIVDPTSKV
jgi:hypothetical protein